MEYGYNKCVAAFTATENHVTYRSGDLLVVADAAHCMMRVIGLVVQSFRLNSRGGRLLDLIKTNRDANMFLQRSTYRWQRSFYR